jgi:uncharacterized protein
MRIVSPYPQSFVVSPSNHKHTLIKTIADSYLAHTIAMHATVFSALPTDAPATDYPKPERRVEGNPRRDTWNRIDASLGAAKSFYSGIWCSEIGKWRIAMATDEQEIFVVTSGRCRLHAEDSTFVEASVGDSVHIPAGFSGAFEVIEAVTKVYVIVE